MTPAQEIENSGRYWARKLLNRVAIESLKGAIKLGTRPGARILSEDFDEIAKHVRPLIEKAQEILPNCRPVGAIVFNKAEGVNWSVRWHQDRVIAVEEKHQLPGYINWTRKSGIWYCEPPIEILENMIFARIHLDEAGMDNGCLEIAGGSHRQGRIEKAGISAIIKNSDIEFCDAEPGDTLFGKALLVHRSRPSLSSRSRLALRIDLANTSLPHPLDWAY